MKSIAKVLKIALVSLLLLTSAHATETVYEDAEDANINGWVVYDNNPAGASINNIADADKNSRVIELQGAGVDNGFSLGNYANRADAWNNQTENILTLDAKFDGFYMLFVILETDNGRKLLYYSSQNANRGVIGGGQYIHLGLGTAHTNNQWYTIRRDLEADLHQYEPDNNIRAVHGIMIRGNGSIDNMSLSNDDVIVPPVAGAINYESAEDGDTVGWSVYDSNPAGAAITNVYSATKNSRVIQLSGASTQNGYMLGNWAGRVNAWNDRDRRNIAWDMNFNEWSMIFVNVETARGQRFLYYTPSTNDRGLIGGQYIHHGLGSQASNGAWFTVTRDLSADLEAYEPGNIITSVNGMLIRGSGELDNIRMFSDQVIPEEPTANAKIFIIGDSTVHNNSNGEMGWGSMLGAHMQNSDNVFNRARSGSSSLSYKTASASHHDWAYTKGLIEETDINNGAYLFIQFGHNDEKPGYLHTEPGRFNSYYNELKVYLDEARDLGITPVLITPVSRQYKGSRTHGQYPQTMKDLAADENVLLIDLEYKSFLEFDTYASDQAIQDVFSYDDGTHFNPTGASIVAGWVKELICDSGNQSLCGQF